MTETLKILIIDDSEDDRKLYQRVLKKKSDAHYEFLEAEEGESGLELLKDETPACVLLDYSLPGRSGIEVLKRLRTRHPFLPVVILTGHGSESVAATAMQEGAQSYISKSNISAETLQRVIRVAIEHCALEKHLHEQPRPIELFTRALVSRVM